VFSRVYVQNALVVSGLSLFCLDILHAIVKVIIKSLNHFSLLMLCKETRLKIVMTP
jgi:hypothetical protein